MKLIKLLLLLLTTLSTIYSFASDDVVNSETKLVDGNVYVLQGFSMQTKSIYNLDGAQLNDEDSLYLIRATGSFDSSYKSVGYRNLWKLKKINGHWGLMNLHFGSRFLSSSPFAYNRTFVYLKKTFDSSCYVKFINVGGVLKINVGEKDFLYENSICTFDFSADPKKSYVQICSIDNPVILFDETRNLDKISRVVMRVKLKRTFKSAEVNTFIVPFDIPDYKSVFGTDTHFLIPVDYTNSNIFFKEIGDNDIIKANVPYLVKGTFNHTSYSVDNAVLDYDGNGECLYTLGELTIHGRYKTENIGKTASYFFKDNQIFKCENTKHVNIAPYRWYFTTVSESPENKQMRLFYNEATNINNIRTDNNIVKGIYTLTGMKMTCDESQLPKGIYIINGRKKVK